MTTTIWKGSKNTVNDLETQNTEFFPKYTVMYVASENKLYYFDQDATNTIDSKNIIQASPQGRWIAINNEGLIKYHSSNSEPQSPPIRENELSFFTQSNRLFISTGTSAINDWTEIPLNSVKIGDNNPSSLNISPEFENQIFIDRVNKKLYSSLDGNSWTKVVLDDENKTTTTISSSSPASNPKSKGDYHINESTEEFYYALDNQTFKVFPFSKDTKLLLDVSNKNNYSQFNDLSDPVDIQVYYAPLFIDISNYDWGRYGYAYNTSRNELNYLNNTVELSNNYDLSSMIKNNGLGYYLFIPTKYNDPDYTMCGEVSSMNIGLEFTNQPDKSKVKIHNATYGYKGDEIVKIKPNDNNGVTLTGNCQILLVQQLNFSANFQVKPYENLTDGSLK